jgi:hypothetical protein
MPTTGDALRDLWRELSVMDWVRAVGVMIRGASRDVLAGVALVADADRARRDRACGLADWLS